MEATLSRPRRSAVRAPIGPYTSTVSSRTRARWGVYLALQKTTLRRIDFDLATGATRLMTVRGFLAWYLATVALVSASGVGAWHGIQSRRHLDTAAVVPLPASETSPPSQQIADARPMQLTASDQVE